MVEPINSSGLISPTTLGIARLGTNFIPGGKVVQAGAKAVDTGLGYLQGNAEAAAMSGAEYSQLTETFGNDLERDARRSPGLARSFGQIRDHYKGAGWKAALSAIGALAGMAAVGAMAGMTIGTFVFPGPGTVVGFILGGVGATIGGFAVDKIVNMFSSPARSMDATEITSQLHAAQQSRQQVAAEEVFVALAGGLRDKDIERIRADVYTLTGKKTLEEALASGKTGALRILMEKYDNAIRGDVGTLTDPLNPALTVSEQYAVAINNGQVDARALLYRDGRLPIDLTSAGSVNLSVPDLPGQNRGPRFRG